MRLKQLRKFLGIFPQIAKLIFQVFWMWMTLDWNVRKARRAFEKELVLQGMAKEDAQRLSKQIKVLKDQIMSSTRARAYSL